MSRTTTLLTHNDGIIFSLSFSYLSLYIILLANISDVALDVNEKASGAVVFNYLIFLQCGEGHGPVENLLKDVHCPPDKSKCAPTPRLRIPPHITKVHKT